MDEYLAPPVQPSAETALTGSEGAQQADAGETQADADLLGGQANKIVSYLGPETRFRTDLYRAISFGGLEANTIIWELGIFLLTISRPRPRTPQKQKLVLQYNRS